jgi:predicted DNA-binding transcriptional regulator AlpA
MNTSSIADAGQIVAEKMKALDEALAHARKEIESAVALAKSKAEPFVGKAEAAEFLGMSVCTLQRRMAERNGPPRYIDGGKVTFLCSELREWKQRWRVNG